MKYTDRDCLKALESKDVSIESFVLIGEDRSPGYYSTSSVYDGVLYDVIIEDNNLAFACKEFLQKNGNKVYKNINEFKKENPDIIC